MTKSRHYIKLLILFCGDIALLYLSLLAGLFVRYYPESGWLLVDQHIIPFSIIFAVWIILFNAFGLYDLKFMKNEKMFLYRILRLMLANTILAIILFYFFPFTIEPRRNLLIIAVLTTVLIALWRYLFNFFLLKTPASRILFFGLNTDMNELAEYILQNRQLGFKPIGFIAENASIPILSPEFLSLPLHTLAEKKLKAIVQETHADSIIISREIKENKTLTKILFQVIPLGVGVVEFAKFHEMVTGKIPHSLIGEIWFLENLIGIKKGLYDSLKRTCDIVLSLVFLFPSFFLFPLAALAIKCESRGPVFFRQKRVGKNGQEFWLVKFRSMVEDAEKMSGFKGGGRDPRHTRVGAFLRKSYLDELPQIFNIIRGEMSFVGPRPERPEYVAELKQKIPFYEMRLLVLPGITGWAQINMEDDASVEDAPEKMQYDLYYIKNRTFILDLLIIIRTIFAILGRQGR
ncbi:MAG: sugar transferase [Candidatus Sungbacteria bacterium]|nr:sugar transferase [Candidatus Sungbacteria bacterium]